MRFDILFHLTTREAFTESGNSDNYTPQDFEEQGFISCYGGSKVKETANRLFRGEDKILLLVIDVSSLRPEVKYEFDEDKGEKVPRIYGPLNKDAIIDKIDIRSEEDGSFDISFKSFS